MSSILNAYISFLSAAFLLVGTWSPLRVVAANSYANNILLSQPRYWIIYLLFIMSFLSHFGQRYAYGPIVSSAGDGKKNKYTLFLFLFLSYMMVSSAWSYDETAALFKALDLFLILLVVLFLHRATSNTSEKNATYFWGGIVFLTAVIALIGVVNIDKIARGRMAVLGGGSNSFGAIMTLGLFGSLYFFNLKSASYRFGFIAFSFVYYLMIMLSGSRGALIATTVALLFYFVINKQSRKTAPIIIVGGVVLVIVFASTQLFSQALDTFKYRFIELLVQREYVSGRDDVFIAALKTGFEYWIYGGGIGSFEALTGWVYPHNIFLEVFAEGGIFGLLLLNLLFFCLAYVIFRYRKVLDPASVAGTLAMFIYMQNSGDLYDSRRFFILAVISLIPSAKILRSNQNYLQAEILFE